MKCYHLHKLTMVSVKSCQFFCLIQISYNEKFHSLVSSKICRFVFTENLLKWPKKGTKKMKFPHCDLPTRLSHFKGLWVMVFFPQMRCNSFVLWVHCHLIWRTSTQIYKESSFKEKNMSKKLVILLYYNEKKSCKNE